MLFLAPVTIFRLFAFLSTLSAFPISPLSPVCVIFFPNVRSSPSRPRRPGFLHPSLHRMHALASATLPSHPIPHHTLSSLLALLASFTFELAGKGPLYRPYGSAWAPNGDLIVSSFKGNQVLRYSSTGKYKGTVGTSDELLMGPNALLYGKDGLLYLTTEGSILINGTLQWNFNSQILRLKNNKWEIFSDDANRYGVIGVAYPNYLGLANSPVNDNLIFVSDYANGVLAFDLTTKVMKGRIETSFTGQPSTNALGALIFNPQPKNSRYEIFVPGFLPNQNNNGAILRLRFDQVSKMDKVRPAFEVAPTSRLNKPIAVIRV